VAFVIGSLSLRERERDRALYEHWIFVKVCCTVHYFFLLLLEMMTNHMYMIKRVVTNKIENRHL
jgi:hypothetical protein